MLARPSRGRRSRRIRAVDARTRGGAAERQLPTDRVSYAIREGTEALRVGLGGGDDDAEEEHSLREFPPAQGREGQGWSQGDPWFGDERARVGFGSQGDIFRGVSRFLDVLCGARDVA